MSQVLQDPQTMPGNSRDTDTHLPARAHYLSDFHVRLAGIAHPACDKGGLTLWALWGIISVVVEGP